eukprot:TRINITY_DN30388_c0_g1_i1.p1 TRINITY_DN30388_c0_g1~~TRINITY_DN30388_c0_g1_i1.p1  ORF type:complete len:542 (+),score=167.63 TRINITY_DN30388_c0_g1_i1:74-1699(+)
MSSRKSIAGDGKKKSIVADRSRSIMGGDRSKSIMSTSSDLRDRSMSRMSMSSAVTSDAGTSVTSTRSVRRGKKEAGGGKASAAVLEELAITKKCYEAEVFALREAAEKDEQHMRDLRDSVAQRDYMMSKAEKRAAEAERRIKNMQHENKEETIKAEQRLIDLAQAKQRLQEEYNDLDQKNSSLTERVDTLEDTIATNRQRIKDLESEIRAVKYKSSEMEDSLKKAIHLAQRDNFDLRMQHTKQEKELEAKLDQVQEELQQLVENIDAALAATPEKIKAAGLFSEGVDSVSVQYQRLLEQCRLRSTRFSESILRVASLHNNVSQHIRETLLQKTPEALVRVISTLAFEVNVREYLEAMFPPDQATPLPTKVYPYTPSAALVYHDLFEGTSADAQRKAAEADAARRPNTVPVRPRLAGRLDTAMTGPKKPFLAPIDNEVKGQAGSNVIAPEQKPVPRKMEALNTSAGGHTPSSFNPTDSTRHLVDSCDSSELCLSPVEAHDSSIAGYNAQRAKQSPLGKTFASTEEEEAAMVAAYERLMGMST